MKSPPRLFAPTLFTHFYPSVKKLLSYLLFSMVMTGAVIMPVQASENGDLAGLINERLSYMKDVASAKVATHQPVEVIAQEEKVLQNTQKMAASLGLDPASVKPFIVAQMNAAKAIQYRYRADWLATPETDWQPRPLESIRSEIAGLSTRILQRLAVELKANGQISPDNQPEFIAAIQQKNLGEADKIQLYKTLKQVRLK